MAYLSDKTLFDGALPVQWRPLLELLHELDLLSHDKELPDQRLKHATRLEAGLIREASNLDEELPPTLRASSPEYKRWFTEAALLWPFFSHVGSPVLLDTMGTTTLEKYDADFPNVDGQRDLLRRALVRTFDWTDSELGAIENKVNRLTRSLRIKRAIARRLASRCDGAIGGELQRRSLELMCSLQGFLPWHPGDVDIVVSAAAVFLCVCYEGTSLTSPGYAERPESERAQISSFLERVYAEQNSFKGVRFPAFGLFDTAQIAPDLIRQLTQAVQAEPDLTGVDQKEVVETLSTMVTILPTGEADKFLVHDVWGHGWQEALCEFEWTYRDLSTINQSIRADLFRKGFENKDGRAVLQPDALLEIVETDLRRLIVIGLNLIVSELLADIVEFKYSRDLSPLPSSSIFPDGPLRLDLSLKDTRLMIHAWRRPYQRLLTDVSERERLQEQLVAAGVVESGLGDALEQGVRLINEHFRLAFEDDTTVVMSGDDGVSANLLQRIMLSLVSIDAALERLFTEGQSRYQKLRSRNAATPIWQCPSACVDFIVLLLGWFYEQERELHVWHLDEFVMRGLGPGMVALEEALQIELARTHQT